MMTKERLQTGQIGLIRLGQVPYGQALALQLTLREELQSFEAGYGPAGYLICLEHPPVVTLGKRGKESDLLSPGLLRERGIEVFRVDRGGEATYHGPGQLVVYPVLRLAELGMGVVEVVRGLARGLADTLADYGVEAAYDPDHPGVWTRAEEPSRKLASVGMRISGGVSTHGAAINLVNDLIPFSYIVACGMPNAPMARLREYVAGELVVEAFRERFLGHFCPCLGADVVEHDAILPAEADWIASMPLG